MLETVKRAREFMSTKFYEEYRFIFRSEEKIKEEKNGFNPLQPRQEINYTVKK